MAACVLCASGCRGASVRPAVYDSRAISATTVARPAAVAGGATWLPQDALRAPDPVADSRYEPSWAEARVVPEGDFEVDVGIGFGLVFPSDQDLKFKREDAAGALIDNLFTHDVTEHPSVLESIDVNVWRTRGFLRDFGLRASVMHWSTRVEAESFQDALPGGGTSPAPPFDTLDEERLGIYLSVERRFSLARRGEAACEAPYVYLGLGGGYVFSEVSHGASSWASSVEAYVGFTFPIADRLRLRAEALFVATRDVDIEGSNLAWEAETSGSATHGSHGHQFAHLDTRFLVALLGIEYRL